MNSYSNSLRRENCGEPAVVTWGVSLLNKTTENVLHGITPLFSLQNPEPPRNEMTRRNPAAISVSYDNAEELGLISLRKWHSAIRIVKYFLQHQSNLDHTSKQIPCPNPTAIYDRRSDKPEDLVTLCSSEQPEGDL
jgi:hypothetical protein